MKNRWVACLKSALALLILIFLLGRLDNWDALFLAFRNAWHRPFWLLTAAGLFGGSLLVCYIRWVVLLKSLTVPITISRSAYLYAIGHAGNLLLPGGFAGDLIKAAAMTRNRRLNRGMALISLVADRMIGLFWLMGMVFTIALLQGWVHASVRPLRLLHQGNGILLAMAALGIVVLVRHATVAAQHPAEPNLSRFAPRQLLRTLADIVKLLSWHPRTVLTTSVLSILNHTGQAASLWCLSLAVGIDPGPILLTFGVFLTANLATVVPLTPGGLGVREVTLPWLMSHYQIAPLADSLAISLLFFGSMLTWAVLFALVWLLNGLRLTQAIGPGAAERDRARQV